MPKTLEIDSIYACRCPCHDPEFTSVAKHKNDTVCCDGKCEYCGTFIVRHKMKHHITECHPYVNEDNSPLEIPFFLRKSSS